MPHPPFKFLINCCFLVSPHQKVGRRTRATVLKLCGFLSRSWEKKKLQRCAILFLSFPAHCVSVCRKHVRKVCDMSWWRRGTAGMPFMLSLNTGGVDSSFLLVCSLQEQAQRKKAARMTGLNHNLSVAPPIQTQVHKISPFSASSAKCGEILRSKNTAHCHRFRGTAQAPATSHCVICVAKSVHKLLLWFPILQIIFAHM